MKKILISAVIIIAFGLYLFIQHRQSAPVSTTDVPGFTSSPSISDVPTSTPSTSATPSSTASSGYRNGSYLSPVADAMYGPLQIKAIISGGKLTDIQFVQFPNAAGHTTEVSNMALPQLKTEAIVSQSANVQIVSGATQTSEAFQQALAAALKMAQ